MFRRQNAETIEEERCNERCVFLEGNAISLTIGGVDEQPEDWAESWRRKIRSPNLFARGIALLCIPIGLSAMVILGSSIQSISKPSTMAKYTRKDEHHFSCPVINDQEVTNESGESFEDIYGKVSRNITTDKEQFLKSFRTAKYDGWGKTYNDVKGNMKPFKSKYFCPHYKPGMKIYESACGIGLNLFMTVEILQECQQQTRGGLKDVNGTDDDNNIFVYGNEYVRESVERSEMILGEGILPAGATRGVVCTGDSTNLSHVPSNVFDLVYSGYITPIQDPLDIGLADGWKKYQDLCNALQNRTGADWMGQELWNAAVKRQRDWYGKWVEEMARIAKPGAPVIVEQVSVSWCAYQNDWGGVDPIFWFEAGAENTYNWNIDQNSIKITEDKIHEHRYHVVMLKKKADE